MTDPNNTDGRSEEREKWDTPQLEWLNLDAIQGGGANDTEDVTDRDPAS